MMAEENQVDTQQQEQSRNDLGQFTPKADPIVDDVMFGTKVDEQSEAFPTGEEEVQFPSNEMRGTPDAQQEPVTPQPEDVTIPANDEVRYEYWQSQADKAKNDLTNMRQHNQLLQNQLNVVNQQGQQQQLPIQGEEESADFPSPPERPSKPRNYSREEAYTDPQSDSAQYLDSIDNWRDTMDEYTQLHSQYQAELSRAERMDFVEEQRRQVAVRDAQRQEYEQLNSVANHVKKSYNASDDDVKEFVAKFSSDESITIDNLWRLYQMEKGGEGGPPAPVRTGSAVFEQTKRAQQVASPMGVVSGQNSQAQGSIEDQIMNELVDGYNKNNPF
jgi:hypothetical protein